MAVDSQFFVLAVIILVAFTTEAATGFGSTVIAVTLGLHLFPIQSLLPLLVPLNQILTAYIVYRHHQHIAYGLLLRGILPVMAIGLVAGLALFHLVSNEALRVLFGLFVVAVAARELLALLSASAPEARPLLPAAARNAGVLAAGVAHGLFASGGPLLVYVLGRSNLDKRTFRSTLAVVWLTLNMVLTAVYFSTGRINADTLSALGLLLPAVMLSIVLGEWVHPRLDEQRFRLAVFGLLVFAGLTALL
ncbi:MAG: sulfite exporter TauE/SafE family protein [Deltaproteobacteria bacterium]|nr:sulfite exporter TauE/SafE family protein [Deltaproteobacteria bacterium]